MHESMVAVNGLGGLAYLWEPFRRALPPYTQLTVLDLPGHGDRPPAADYRYEALAADVAHRTSAMAPFPLLGWSVGAAVAWLLAAARPGRVTHLVLIEPAAPHQSRFLAGPVPEPAHPFTFASAAEAVAMLGRIDPTFTSADVEAGYRVNARGRLEPRFDPAIFPVLVQDARARGQEILAALRTIRVPVLVLLGERSQLTGAQAQEIADAVPNARVERARGAGHFLVRERPGEVARFVLRFIERR